MAIIAHSSQSFFGGTPSSEILFVDRDVADVSTLLAGLRPGVEVVRLPHQGDPITAMALTLCGRRDIAAVHILSHGAPGALALSGKRFDAAAFAARPALTEAIREALAESAEIILYGCSVADTAIGRGFVAVLSDLLERPVAASDRPVGASDLGGDWCIPAKGALAFTGAAQAAYPGTLPVATFGIVTTLNTTSTLTSNESGTSIDVVTSDGSPMAGVSSGFLDPGVISHTVSYTLTFGGAVTITQFQIGEFENNQGSGNYVFTPDTGSAVTLADNSGSISGAIATLNPSDWTGVTTMTVSYTGGVNWRVGLDNINFTVATVNVTTTAGGFNTTTGLNLTPASALADTNDTLTIADASHITSTSVANGGGGTDTIVLANGSDLTTTGFTLSNFETVTLAAGASVTMSESQHDGFSTINGNSGSETITLSSADGDGTVTADADIESYVLNGAFTLTLAAGAQNVTGNDADSQTVRTDSIETLTGTLNGGAGGTDVLTLDTGDNIAGATISNFENLSLVSSASVTMTVAQHDGFTGTITGGGGADQITFSATGGDTATTGASAIETYVLGTSGITFTLGAAGQNVTGSSGSDTVNVGALTATGTINAAGATDVLQMDNGANISGATVSNFEDLTLTSGASVTLAASQLSQFSGTITAAGSETVNVTGDGNVTTLANVETFSVGDDSSNTRTITVSGTGTSVTASSTTDAVTFSLASGSYTGTFTGDATTGDTLSLANGANIAGGTVTAIGTLNVASGATVTMTEAQHDGFATIDGTGTNKIIISTATDGLTADADIEQYELGAANSLTLSAAGQTVSGSTGDDTINAGTLSVTGTIDGGGGTDTLSLGNGSNLTGATVSNFENLTLASGSSVTLTAGQHAQFTGTVTAAGSETVSVTGDGDFTTLANVETYSVGDDGTNTRTITVNGAGTSVSASSATDAVTFNLGTLTYTGTITGDGTTNDTLSLGTGANIAGGTISNVENLTLASGGSFTMTLTQLAGFTGTVTAAGSETLTLSGDGDFSTVSGIESVNLGDSSTNLRTITLTNAAHSASATSTTDAVTFNGAGLTLTGTLTGEGTVNDTLSIADGANLSGATISGIENLTLASGASVTMTAAQLNGFTGTTTAAGTETVTLSATGSIASASVSAIETLATASDTSAQTITLTAAQAAGKTLTAGDSGLDHFVVTGSTGSQSITGSAGADTLDGGAGDDTLVGGSAADAVSGGAGNDVVSGGSGYDTLAGGDGADTFTGSTSDFNGDTIADFAVGDSIVVTGTDLSSLNGTTASGTIAISGSIDTTLTGITSASGTFAATFANGDTTITLVAPQSSGGGGGGGGGSSSGSSGGSVVVTDSTPSDSTGGNRTITNNGSSSGSAAIVENTGNNSNVVTATLPSSVTVTSTGPASATLGTSSLQTLNSAISARNSASTAQLTSGADTFLNRLATTTTLDIRTIVPTTTASSLSSPIVITGSTTSDGSSQSEAFVIDLRSLPTGSTLQLDNIEFASVMGSATVNGGSGDNFVTGDENSQFISLGVGNDTLYGGAGADTIGSGSGKDILYGNQDNDRVFGGTEEDTVYGGANEDVVYGNQHSDVVYGNQGYDTLYGGQDDDTLYGGQHQDLLYGNAGADVLYGNTGLDTLYGGAGDDTLDGGAGADTLIGGAGNDVLKGGLSSDDGANDGSFDVLSGGEGDDSLYGGAGIDWIYTGTGADRIYIEEMNGFDVVADFDVAAGDQLMIQANLNGLSLTTAADVIARATDDVDGNVEINLNGGYIRLIGIQSSELNESYFGFY